MLQSSVDGLAMKSEARLAMRSHSPGEFGKASPADLKGPLAARACRITSSSCVECRPSRVGSVPPPPVPMPPPPPLAAPVLEDAPPSAHRLPGEGCLTRRWHRGTLTHLWLDAGGQ